MNLLGLEAIRPGETGSRAFKLGAMSQQLSGILPDGWRVEPLSYNDLECLWLTATNGVDVAKIPLEVCHDMLSGYINLNAYFESETIG